jgi:parallel beta-helix repeat protein
MVDEAGPGTQFALLPGTHRTGESHPKDGMVFEGFPGTILNGSELLDGFTADGATWTLTGVELNQKPHGECVGEYQACALRNDVFMDDTMLWRVDDRSEVVAGTWWSDGSTLVVADDPALRKVEVSITQHAFISDANDVTIRGLVVEKYASLAQGGAIQAQIPGEGPHGANWLIEDVEARLNHAAGIRAGTATTIRRVHTHHNGQQGITGGGGENILVEFSEINNNNIRGFSPGWEAGGAKFTRTDGLILRNLDVHDNLGTGLWTDINCYNTTYEGNVVYDNNGPGIFHEISYDAVIRDNVVYGNGFAQSIWLWGAGILVAGSSGVEITGNTVYDNADGIAGIQQFREGEDGLWKLENLNVHDNVVTMRYGQSGVVEDMGDPGVFLDRNIRFDNNAYIGATHDAFAWDGHNLTWTRWVEAGQDTNGTQGDG